MEEVSFLDVSGRIARNLIQMTTSSPQSTSVYEHPASCSISQEELAGIVGASRVMVNKVLNSFVDLGLISIGRRRITVVNMVELHRIASYDRES